MSHADAALTPKARLRVAHLVDHGQPIGQHREPRPAGLSRVHRRHSRRVGGRRGYPAVARAWDRVYGPDVMEAVLDRSGPDGPRHYLLGGSPETLAALQSVIAERWPLAAVVGAESPPFRALSAEEVAAQAARIRDSGATIVWVGLGTPKQDWEVARLAGSVPVAAMAVGAAFDFLAGVKPQAPLWMQKSGTEWAFRLASEPKRLAKRYLWGNPRFLLAAAREPGLRNRGRQ